MSGGSLPPGFDPSKTPLGPPPPGVVPNFVDPYDEAPMAEGIILTLFGIQVLVVATRLWVRSRITRSLGWDDFFAAAATAFGAVEVAIQTRIYHYGLGRHVWDVPLSNFMAVEYNRILETIQIITPLINLTFKLTVLSLLLRVFPYRVQRSTAIFAWVGVGLVVTFNLICFILSMYACIPRPGSGGFIPATCGAEAMGEQIILAGNIFNMVIDLYMFIFPLHAIWNLNLSRKRRVGIVLVLGTGLAACVCSILTLAFRVAWKNYYDQTLYQGRLAIVNNAETSIGVITACLPCLASLWAYVGEVRSMSGVSSASKIRVLLSGSRGYVLSQNSTGQHGSRSAGAHGSEIKSTITTSDGYDDTGAAQLVTAVKKTSTTRDIYELNERQVEADSF